MEKEPTKRMLAAAPGLAGSGQPVDLNTPPRAPARPEQFSSPLASEPPEPAVSAGPQPDSPSAKRLDGARLGGDRAPPAQSPGKGLGGLSADQGRATSVGQASISLAQAPGKGSGGEPSYWTSNALGQSSGAGASGAPANRGRRAGDSGADAAHLATGPTGGVWTLDNHDYECGPNRWRCREFSPHSEFNRDYNRLASSFEIIEERDSLRRFLYSNCDVLEALFRIMPALQARPEVLAAQIIMLVDCEEACDSVGIGVKINFRSPRELVSAFDRLSKEVVYPLFGDAGDERLLLTVHWVEDQSQNGHHA